MYELKESRQPPKTFANMVSNMLHERRFRPFFGECQFYGHCRPMSTAPAPAPALGDWPGPARRRLGARGRPLGAAP